MSQLLKDKIALVTGGSRGIGAGIAKAFAREGARVFINYKKDKTAAESVAHTIENAGGLANICQADLADLASVHRMFASVAESAGRLDVLVNNAAVGAARPLSEIPDEHVAELFSVNVFGLVAASREAVGLFSERGGRIINISSLNGRIASPGASIYAATKAAMESLTRSWALELGPRGITVNAVAPGWTDTDMLASVLPRDQWSQLEALTSLRRVGQPADIADVAVFLASDAARWVTGQVIGADGGIRAF